MGPKRRPAAVRRSFARWSYSKQDLEAAVKHVQLHGTPQRVAATMFGVPPTTLNDALRNRHNSGVLGAPTALTEAQEKTLVNWLKYMQRIGYPLIRSQFAKEVQKIIEDAKVPNPFKQDGLPSKGWVQKFLKRHKKEIRMRLPSRLSVGHTMLKRADIQRWYTEVRTHFAEIPGGLEALNDPSRVFNADESGFPLDASTGRVAKVLAGKGCKHVRLRAPGSKAQFTVLGCSNAAGDYMPPFMIFPGRSCI